MRRRVRVLPRADRDFDEKIDYFVTEGLPYVAARFTEAVFASYDHLAEFPESGSPRLSKTPGLESVRVWPVKEFPAHLIFYRVKADAIEIIRLGHAARELARFLED